MAQGITNLVWALAVLGHSDLRLLAEVDVAVIPRLPQFEAQHLSNLLWGFAKLGESPSPPEPLNCCGASPSSVSPPARLSP